MKIIRYLRYLFLTISLIIGIIAMQYQPSLAEDYFVGSQDVLRITVYEHPDLTTVVRVSEGGLRRYLHENVQG